MTRPEIEPSAKHPGALTKAWVRLQMLIHARPAAISLPLLFGFAITIVLTALSGSMQIYWLCTGTMMVAASIWIGRFRGPPDCSKAVEAERRPARRA